MVTREDVPTSTNTELLSTLSPREHKIDVHNQTRKEFSYLLRQEVLEAGHNGIRFRLLEIREGTGNQHDHGKYNTDVELQQKQGAQNTRLKA